jgi:hypothetical protein
MECENVNVNISTFLVLYRIAIRHQPTENNKGNPNTPQTISEEHFVQAWISEVPWTECPGRKEDKR